MIHTTINNEGEDRERRTRLERKEGIILVHSFYRICGISMTSSSSGESERQTT
jgi:hypothetical protein